MTLTSSTSTTAAVFDSPLGWMATLWRGGRLSRLAFGLVGPVQAVRSVEATDLPLADHDRSDLIPRLQAFAGGAVDDFLDVSLDWDGVSDFQRCVLGQCRKIRWSQTVSYGQLAKRAGSPRAARAVGRVMATNRWPLIVPCHRVIASGGGLGGYSARQGLRMKRKLLAREAVFPNG